jgi:N utilization substance protein A
MLFVRGVGERTIQLLNEAGYRSAEDIRKEDEDRLAIKTGLGIKKARAIKQGAEHFLTSESKLIDAARKVAAKAAKDREAEASLEAPVEATEAAPHEMPLEKSPA